MATIQGATTPRTDTLAPIDRANTTPVSLPPTIVPIFSARNTTPAHLAPTPLSFPLSPKLVHRTLSPRSSPNSLTGAAALADARRAKRQRAMQPDRQVSPNPNVLALNALMGNHETSKPSDAPPSLISETLRKAAETSARLSSRSPGVQQAKSNGTRPRSRTPGTAGPSAMTTSASPLQGPSQFVEEPESISENGDDAGPSHRDDDTRPFTYPGPMPTHSQETPSRRDLTYDSGSKSAKRHKCPYCSTDFTRHHNLKSHLLTHSQEKPYVCQTCQARFRRLHDLKRHTKLHTGERPHTCPKCGRKFARGDALARHNKGPGGCANLKSGLGEDDEGDDMDGLEYDNDNGEDEGEGDSEMMDAAARRGSEPNRKRAHPDTSPEAAHATYRQHSSTYPPPLNHVARPEAGPMGPPQNLLSPSSKAPLQERPSGPPPTSSEPQYHSQYYPQPGGPSYPPPAVVDSPRPISPRSEQHRLLVNDPQGLRNRSSSLSSQYQSTQYSRGIGAPPPAHMTTHAPQLPSLPSMAPGHHATGPPTIFTHHHTHSHPPSGSNPGSHSSHGHSSGSSMRDIIGQEPQDLMGYIRSLEQRISRMSDEYELRLGRLQQELIDIRSHGFASR